MHVYTPAYNDIVMRVLRTERWERQFEQLERQRQQQ